MNMEYVLFDVVIAALLILAVVYGISVLTQWLQQR